MTPGILQVILTNFPKRAECGIILKFEKKVKKSWIFPEKTPYLENSWASAQGKIVQDKHITLLLKKYGVGF